jgi:hypothetical protein
MRICIIRTISEYWISRQSWLVVDQSELQNWLFQDGMDCRCFVSPCSYFQNHLNYPNHAQISLALSMNNGLFSEQSSSEFNLFDLIHWLYSDNSRVPLRLKGTFQWSDFAFAKRYDSANSRTNGHFHEIFTSLSLGSNDLFVSPVPSKNSSPIWTFECGWTNWMT